MSKSRVPPRLLPLLVLLAACGGSSVRTSRAGDGDTYEVRFNRSPTVGSRRHVVKESTSTEERILSVQGQVVETEREGTTVRLDAVAEILSVEGGHASRVRYTVRSCTRSEQGGSRVESLLEEGQVLEVTLAARDEDATVTIDGRPAPAALVSAISPVFDLTYDQHDEDALFGTRAQVAIGERWPLDTRTIAAQLAESTPVQLDASNTRGEGRLLERTTVDGVDGLRVALALTADGVHIGGLPPEATIRNGEFELQMGGFFPLDTSMPRLEESTEMTIRVHMDISTPNGDAEMRMNMHFLTTERVDVL